MRSVAVAHQIAEVTGVSQKCPVVIRTVTAVCISSSVGARLICAYGALRAGAGAGAGAE